MKYFHVHPAMCSLTVWFGLYYVMHLVGGRGNYAKLAYFESSSLKNGTRRWLSHQQGKDLYPTTTTNV